MIALLAETAGAMALLCAGSLLLPHPEALFILLAGVARFVVLGATVQRVRAPIRPIRL